MCCSHLTVNSRHQNRQRVCGTNWMMMCAAASCSEDSPFLWYNYHASSCRQASSFPSWIIRVLQLMCWELRWEMSLDHIWSCHTSLAREEWGGGGREGGSAEKDRKEKMNPFPSLHHCNCLRAAHLHIFPHLTEALQPFWHVVVTHMHTHPREVPDERTPTSMAGLWKRVCRRDKSVTQQMPASNNPSYHVSNEAAYTHTRTHTHICRSHDIWLQLREKTYGRSTVQ